MIIRHAEKPHHSSSPHGINAEGDHDGHSLTVDGWLRAGALVGLFAPSRGEPPVGFRRPDTIYGSAYEEEAIHKIAEHLGEVSPPPPVHWPGDRFDVVWTFTRNGNGWRFAQVPQMLLPGDLPYPITD
jgi:hypothetical protein